MEVLCNIQGGRGRGCGGSIRGGGRGGRPNYVMQYYRKTRLGWQDYPDPRWVSKISCQTPKGEGREFSDTPPRIGGSSCQPHLVLLL